MHEGHHHTDDDLQRQTYLYIIHKRVTTRRHHQRIRRSGERRGEAHTGSQGYRQEEGVWTHPYLLRCHPGNRRHENRRGGIADKHRHERGGEERYLGRQR